MRYINLFYIIYRGLGNFDFDEKNSEILVKKHKTPPFAAYLISGQANKAGARRLPCV